MSENSNEAANETPAVESATEQPAESSCCKRGSSCTPHASIIIAFIALILAGYAAYSAAQGRDNSTVEARIAQLESQTSGISEQITNLDAQIKSNRENLIQTKLKKALQSIQEIGNLAGEGTKAAISEVENMLKTLTAISDQLTTPAPTETTPPASIEPASEAASELTTKPETAPETSAPAEITQPESVASESTPSESTPTKSTPSESTQAEPATTPEQPAATEPATTTLDNNAADQAPATTEAVPAQPADAAPVAPADSQTATGSSPADSTPTSEPSAPQAF